MKKRLQHQAQSSAATEQPAEAEPSKKAAEGKQDVADQAQPSKYRTPSVRLRDVLQTFPKFSGRLFDVRREVVPDPWRRRG